MFISPNEPRANVSSRHFFGQAGFTLLEILIALFIFAILSLILTTVLRRVIDTHAHTEQVASILRDTDLALLKLSRDLESTVNRSVADTSGKLKATFIGTTNGFEFTHGGFISAEKSSLERTAYAFKEESWSRSTWQVLDLAPSSEAQTRTLLTELKGVSVEYLDADKRFHTTWPVEPQSLDTLPKAVRVNFVFADGGTLSQLYVIPAATPKTKNAPPSP